MDKSEEMALAAYHALEDKKGEDIKIIKIAGVSTIADYFIISNGTNESQTQAMSDSVEEALYKLGYEPKHIEGIRNKSWILMDYGDIVIHIFSKDDRVIYDLERLWKDGVTLSVEELEQGAGE